MGNSASSVTQQRPAPNTLDNYVSELAYVDYEKNIGTSRLLKSIKGRHENGPLVVKIFVKPHVGVTLRHWQKKLKTERDTLVDVPNVYTYQTFLETEQAAYLVRQSLASNLYDRISTRPFLTAVEKKWFTFQILTGMRDLRSKKISHGDFKPSNVLVTSQNWLLITDLACYKPVHIPEDDPADFSLFFDTSGRRSCYLAPERFFSAGSGEAMKRDQYRWEDGKRDGRITEEMDVFSAGCTIAELWLEGKELFSLSAMLAWRKDQWSPVALVESIEDDGIRSLVLQMISKSPSERPTFDHILSTHRTTTFPEYFYTFLHQYVVSVNDISEQFPLPHKHHLNPSSNVSEASSNASSPAKSTRKVAPDCTADARINKIASDFESIRIYLEHDDEGTEEMPKNPVEDGCALLILPLVTSHIRNCQRPSSKIQALELLLLLASYLTDEAKLDKLLPFVIILLRDPTPSVRSAAIQILAEILEMVTAITPSNAGVIPQYVLPNASPLATDSAESVRAAYANVIAKIAETGARFLEMAQALRVHRAFTLTEELDLADGTQDETYDSSMNELHNIIQDDVGALLTDNSSVVKRSVLQHISTLCVFFGRNKTNDVLLGHMLTSLNDRDWMFRATFVESIVGVAATAGSKSLEEYILPLMVQALSDVEEFVVAQVLRSLEDLVELELLRKAPLWGSLNSSFGLLCHPNLWIRQGAAGFVGAAAASLGAINVADAWCILYPNLRPLLQAEVEEMSRLTLLDNVIPPLSRVLLVAALDWAMSAKNSKFWSLKDQAQRSAKPLASTSTSKESWLNDDDTHLERLRERGLTEVDELKLLSMRQHLSNVAGGLKGSRAPANEATTSLSEISLKAVDVTPQTVFISPRGPEAQKRSSIQPGRRQSRGQIESDTLSRVSPMRTESVSTRNGISALSKDPNIQKRPNQPQTQLLPGEIPALSSPAESVVSVADSSAVPNQRPRGTGHRIYSGSVDGSQKATALVGSIKTNAVGTVATVEPSMRMKAFDELASSSGWATPTHIEGNDQGGTNLPFISTYDGSDPSITNLLEAIYLESFKDPLLNFGPRVTGNSRRRAATPPPRSFPRNEGPGQREASLLANFKEHSAEISGIIVSPDHVFFVTSSFDGTIRVWDTSRLERSITSKARLVQRRQAAIACICNIEASHCFAAASVDGNISVLRVHVGSGSTSPKYSHLQTLRNYQLEDPGDYVQCMVHFDAENTSNLLCATQRSVIFRLDLHTMQIKQTLMNPPGLGPITSICIGPEHTWIVVGTLGGHLCLWDIRFGLLLRTWRPASFTPILNQQRSIRQVVRHPTKGTNGWVIVVADPAGFIAGEENATSLSTVVETWDVEQCVLVEAFVVPEKVIRHAPPHITDIQPSPAQLQETEPSASQRIDELLQLSGSKSKSSENHQSATSAVHAVAVGADAPVSETVGWADSSFENIQGSGPRGFVISGGDDRKVRWWDLNHVERSRILVGRNGKEEETYTQSTGFPSQTDDQKPVYYCEVRRPLQSQKSKSSSTQPASPLEIHSDTITYLTTLYTPFSPDKCIVSGDRSGAVKVWRVTE